MTVESDLSGTAEQTARIPSNLYALIRQSYDTREKVLDWCLAIGVVGVLVFVFRDDIRGAFFPTPEVNAGRDDAPQASQDVASAFPFGGRISDRFYTYNLPSSRAFKRHPVPSGTRIPADPSANPSFDAEDQETT